MVIEKTARAHEHPGTKTEPHYTNILGFDVDFTRSDIVKLFLGSAALVGGSISAVWLLSFILNVAFGRISLW